MTTELLRRIHHLEQLVDGPSSGIEPEARELQALRLERALIQVERRIRALDPTLHPSLDIFEGERAELGARARVLEEKIAWLRAGSGRTADGAPPPGSEHALWAALHTLVVVLRTDPSVPVHVVEGWKERLVVRVRARRKRLQAVEDELNRARALLLQARSALRALAPVADALADEAVDARELLVAERGGIAATLETARLVFADARLAFARLAEQWPELGELARRPDWTRIPIFGARQRVEPGRDAGEAWSVAGLRRRVHETESMVGGLALWVGELAAAVQAAPPPSEEVSPPGS